MTFKLLSSNKKCHGMIKTFGLPAGSTCPGKGGQVCVECYAQKGCYRFGVVRKAQAKRMALSMSSRFVGLMTSEIKRSKCRYVRIHDSGDFYSQAYLDKWVAIAKECPDRKFYCYTKSLHLDWSEFDSLPNCARTQSLGGKYDEMVNPIVSTCMVDAMGKTYLNDMTCAKKMFRGENIHLKLRIMK